MQRVAQRFRTTWMTKICLKILAKLVTPTIKITKANPSVYLGKIINFKCRAPNLESVNRSSKCSKVATQLQVVQKELSLLPTMPMDNNSKSDSRPIQLFSMVLTATYYRMRFQDPSKQMVMQMRTVSNLWASAINKIK
jgi:hypothetical protein